MSNTDVLGELLKKVNTDTIDKLFQHEDFLDAHENVRVTNTMRLNMFRFLNELFKENMTDPKMVAQMRGLMKEVDGAVFMLQRLSQEDKHLDNEEMLAKVLNEFTRNMRKNPYEERARMFREGGVDIEEPALPALECEGEFEDVAGSNHIGLVTMNYETFEEEVVPTLAKPDVEDEEPLPEPTTAADRDEPLPPPLPGSL